MVVQGVFQSRLCTASFFFTAVPMILNISHCPVIELPTMNSDYFDYFVRVDGWSMSSDLCINWKRKLTSYLQIDT